MDMDELRLSDDRCTSDPVEIHEHLTEWFDNIYRGPDGTGKGVHAPGADWTTFLSDRAAFDNFTSHTTLNQNMKDKVWRALRVYDQSAPDLREEAIAAVHTTPTLEQFRAAIRRPRGGMTGGISGCTFNMMSQWSDTAIELLHEILTAMMIKFELRLTWGREAILEELRYSKLPVLAEPMTLRP